MTTHGESESANGSGAGTGGPQNRPSEQPEEIAKRVLLATVGAAAAARDAAQEFIDRYAELGERVSEEARAKVDEVREQNRDAASRAKRYVRSGMDAFLDVFDMPSKTDVEALQVKLNALNRKLDDLQMQSQREPFVPPEASEGPPPPPDLEP